MCGRSCGFGRRDQVDNLICCHNGAGVVGKIGDESGAHKLVRVIGSCVFYDGDFVPKLSGKANRRFHTRVGNEPDDDELVDAMFFQQQIQIRVGKAARTPMLLCHDVAGLGLELVADLATPGAVFECLSRPRRLLDRRDVFFQVS